MTHITLSLPGNLRYISLQQLIVPSTFSITPALDIFAHAGKHVGSQK